MQDFERELQDERRRQVEDEDGGTGWMSVQVDQQPVDIKEEEKAPLEEEPVVDAGIAGALLLAKKKGLLEQDNHRRSSAPKHAIDLCAQHYSIEDKRYEYVCLNVCTFIQHNIF